MYSVLHIAHIHTHYEGRRVKKKKKKTWIEAETQGEYGLDLDEKRKNRTTTHRRSHTTQTKGMWASMAQNLRK